MTTTAMMATLIDFSRQWMHVLLLWSLQATVLVAAAWIAGALGRSAPAAIRHRFWLLTMIGVAGLPLWSFAAGYLPLQQPITESLMPFVTPSEPFSGSTQEVRSDAPLGIESESSLSYSAAAWVTAFAVWSLGVVYTFFRTAVAFARQRAVLRSVIRDRELVSPKGLRIAVGYSPVVRTPQLMGLFRPVVLLPHDIEEWSTPEEIAGMLLHELAHLDRRDHYVLPFQAALSAVFFFHPAVRYGINRLRTERELACDEAVTGQGVTAACYAEALLKVADRGLRAAEPYQLAFDSRNILARRIQMILRGNDRRTDRRSHHTVVVQAAALFVLMTLLLLPRERMALPLQEPALPAGPVPAPAPVPAPVALPAIPPAVAAAPPPIVPVAAPAQALTRLSGRVFDQTAAVIPGVSVTLQGESRLVSVTNNTGMYTFPEVPVGVYELIVSLPGFRTMRLTNLRLSQPVQQDVTLQIAAVTTQVEVTARRGPVEPPPPASPPPPPPPPPIRVGGDVAQANLIFSAKPVYPPAARAAGVEGSVVIQAVITTDGTISDPRVLNAEVHPELNSAALDAVKRWRYRPTMLNGQPIATVTTITVNFSLQD